MTRSGRDHAAGTQDAPASGTWGTAGLVLGAGSAGLLTLVLVLLLGGGAPQAAPAGLPQAGPVVDWVVAVAPLFTTAAGAVTVGFALLAGGFLGRIAVVAAAVRATRVFAAAWVGLCLVTVAATALRANALASGGLEWSQLAAVTQVRASFLEAVLAGAALLLVGRVPRVALPLALAALFPEVLTGHVRTADAPLLTAAALVTHVVAAALWVGGLGALTWLTARHVSSWSTALAGYSRMAFGCVVVLAFSGTVAALTRVTSVGDLFGSAYGVVIVLKAMVLVTLAAVGLLQRRHVLARGVRGRRDFVLLAGSELILMALAFSLAAGLAQTPPP